MFKRNGLCDANPFDVVGELCQFRFVGLFVTLSKPPQIALNVTEMHRLSGECSEHSAECAHGSTFRIAQVRPGV